MQHKALFALQNIKHSASTEPDSVCAVFYCDLKDSGFADLDDDGAARLSQCVRVLEKIAAAAVVKDQQLQRALTAEEYSEYRASFDLSVTHTEDEWLQTRPPVLDHYIALVKRGDFYNALADRFARAKRPTYDTRGQSGALRMRRKAEAMYEKATESLQAITVGKDDAVEIERWLDRFISWTIGEEPSIDVVGIPRVRGSKSKHSQANSRPLWGVQRGKFWRQREAI